MKHVLYVEDDESLAYLTVDNLMQSGYQVDHARDGLSALQKFKTSSYDICILDIMLPHLDGFALAEEIRKLNHEVPILFLSARTLKEDRIKGLRLGADDYIVKPFSIEELVLRMEVFLTRSKKENRTTTSYRLGNIEFDSDNLQLCISGKEPLPLTQKEAQLLKLFLDNRNKVLKREEILIALWGDDDYFMGRSLDVFISRLRKIFSGESYVSIENVHGVGFRLCLKDQKPA